MANELSTESAGRVRQKTYMIGRAPTAGPSPGVFYMLKSLFLHLAANKGNPDLSLVNITATSIDDAGGQVLVNGACTLYAAWGKKAATATDVYLVLFDDATDDAGAGTDGRVVIPFLVSGEEGFYMNPDGLTMAAGVVAKAYTDFDGTTDSTDTDCPNGFVIVGA